MDVIKRLLSDFRPADWAILIVDLLVLVLIIIEFAYHLRRDRKEDLRQKIANERIRAIREVMSKGQQLQHSSVPVGDSGVDRWYQSVIKWTEETRLLLASYSLHADASFMDVSRALPVGTYGSVGAAFEYANLLARLANLRGIIEKSDVYLK